MSVDLFPAPQQAVLVCLCTYCFSFYTSEDYVVLIIVRMEVMIRMIKPPFTGKEQKTGGVCGCWGEKGVSFFRTPKIFP